MKKTIIFTCILMFNIKFVLLFAQVQQPTDIDLLTELNTAALPTVFNWTPTDSLPNGWFSYGLGAYTTGNDAPNAGKFNSQNDSLVIHYNQSATTLNFFLKAYSLKPPYIFTVLESIDGITYTTIDIFSDSLKIIPSKYTGFTLHPLANSRYVKFEYTKRMGGNIAIDDISLSASETTTDINDKADKPMVYIYPNPVHHILYIQSYEASIDANIFDLLGNQVAKRQLQINDSAEINTSTFKPGVYVVRIKSGNNEIKTLKFIKR